MSRGFTGGGNRSMKGSEALAISRGMREGHQGTDKFGRVLVAAAEGVADLWRQSGLHVPPTAARLHDIVAFDATNDKLGGTGANSVFVFGVGNLWERQSEEVALDALGVGVTTKTYRDIYRSKVGDSGSLNINDSLITITAQVDATVQILIPAGKGQSQRAIYTVAAGCKGYILNYYTTLLRAGSSNPAPQALVELMTRENLDDPLSSWHVERVRSAVLTGTSSLPPEPFGFPLEIIGPAQVKLRISETTVAAMDISGGFDIHDIVDGASL